MKAENAAMLAELNDELKIEDIIDQGVDGEGWFWLLAAIQVIEC